MKVKGKYFSLLVAAGFAALLYDPFPTLAAVAPSLGAAASYTVLGTNSTPIAGTVTCTTSTINGKVGTTFTSITNTGPCVITGTIDAPVGGPVVAAFNTAYSNLDSQNPCDTIQSGTLAGVTLPPGVHCFTAGAALTGLLTLNGPSTGIWVFKIGTSGTGGLAGTSFQVVMAGGGQACNVYWRTAQAAAMTDSNFIGTILAGTAITLTRGNYVGRALATTNVTVTDVQPMTFAGAGCSTGATTFSTQASPGVVLGAAISDTATLSGGVTPTGAITWNLYGPNNGFCTGAAIFTSFLPISGNGIYVSGSFTPVLAGTYRWIANYSGDVNNAPIATACNDANETMVVSNGGAVTTVLTTQASPGVALGAAIFDTATLSGGAAPTGTITFNLYGPNDATCTGAAIFTSAVPVSGNGAYPSASFTPTTAGTYRWIANYSGDANNVGTANACNAVNENVVIAAIIPTLSEWAMIMMAALLVLFGVAGIRRHAM
ncbi:MAG TPA: IPTL-CTERM sorting domain-containing protein [Methylomirabilota bacterium]|nr:IPTL-CTERM sorting domain-containing protein [Methylomirabilota bacterium]